jgi:hypothetical protein
MTADSGQQNDYRLALGKRADDLGLILAQVGDSYELRQAETPPDAVPEFVGADLAAIDDFLSRREERA